MAATDDRSNVTTASKGNSMLTPLRLLGATAALALAAAAPCAALENQTSTGQVALVDTPILRVPAIGTAPEIDGVLSDGEWDDASALSGFWYDYGQADFRFMAPHQTQLRVLAAYDKEFLYLCYDTPVYPEDSWMIARARFPDVIGHPTYGLQWDDHVEVELRPFADNVEGFRRGLFKWFVNPLNNFSDQYWSQEGGDGMAWPPDKDHRLVAASKPDGKSWVLEMRVPLASMVHGSYDDQTSEGTPVVQLPPPDGTAYRAWFTRAIGGNGNFFNVFDNHSWNTTKTKLIFDSQCVAFQIVDLGEIMNDQIDVTLQMKNHNTRSETVQLGFFVENAEGLVYSSYDDDATEGGLIELKPGETKSVRLRKRFPAISRNGNTLWFDVRSAGSPAKPLFRTRLIDFHSMEGGVANSIPFMWRRVDVIARMRPPRKDFEFDYAWSPYQRRLSATVDKGVYGGSEEAKRAVEARLVVMRDDIDETEVAEGRATFTHDFACILLDLPDIEEGEYKVSLLMFDENKRIVGEVNPPPFMVKDSYPWVHNEIGQNDVVWDPYIPMSAEGNRFTTLKHRFEVASSGLPAQIDITVGEEDLPLEHRGGGEVAPEILAEVGRGPQLRAPMRLIATVGGEVVEATVTRPAELVRAWQSELQYRSELDLAGIPVTLDVTYDCDGSIHAALTYGGETPVTIEGMQLLMDVRGAVDTKVSAMRGGGMAAADSWECSLPEGEGVVWDSAEQDRAELYYSHFVPWFWFGNGDRGFSWICDSDEHWELDKTGTAMQLERGADGQVTLRVHFVNHPSEISGPRTIDFSMLVHPSKPKPAGHRRYAWFYRGDEWAARYAGLPLAVSDDILAQDRLDYMIKVSGSDRPDAEALTAQMHDAPLEFDVAAPPWVRYYQQRGRFNSLPSVIDNAYTGELTGHSVPIKTNKERMFKMIVDGEEKMMTPEGYPGVFCKMNRAWQDLAVFHLSRHAKIARRSGYWWDETWPAYRDGCIATGGAYIRDPEEVEADELPWQDTYSTLPMRGMFKRLARVYKEEDLTMRHHFWANNGGTCMEAFGWNTLLVEECAADVKSRDIDNVVSYPISLFRYAAHSYTGLVASMTSGGAIHAGGDKMLDRQYLGRVLLHDIGVQPIGPHGHFAHPEQFLRVIDFLADFGYYEDVGTEWIPYWRTGDALSVQIDGAPAQKVYASVFRRKIDGGGTKAFVVLMNEQDIDVDVSLTATDPERVFGGANTRTASAVRAGQAEGALAEWWQGLSGRDGDRAALEDIESGEAILRDGEGERYPSITIGAHDCRILYLETGP